MRILIGGDVCFKVTREAAGAAYCRNVLRQVLPAFRQADVRLLNLENPLALPGVGAPIVKSGPCISGLPQNLAFLQECGTDCAVLANNHFGDYGPDAAVATLHLLNENGIAHVGGGEDAGQAYEAFRAERDGVSVSFLAVCENEFGCADSNSSGAAGYDPRRLYRRIREEKQRSDKVVVIFHGGNEENPLPSPDTVDRYRMLIDWGADAVVGGHPHCMQGYEVYRDCPIVYSMGNFYFPHPDCGDGWHHGYLVQLELLPGQPVSFVPVPYVHDPETDTLRLLTGAEKDRILCYLQKLSRITADATLLERYFDAWCVMKGIYYAGHLQSGTDLRQKPFSPEQQRQLAQEKNVLSCEAHRYLVKHTLELAMVGRLEEAAAFTPSPEKLHQIPQ